MIGSLAHNWWALALRGIAAILFALVAFILPGITLQVLLLIFAAYLLIDGIFALVAGVRALENHERWWMLVLEGVIGLAAAVVIVLRPAPSLIAFIYFIAFWAVASGVALLVAAFQMHRRHGEGILILSGALSVVWGVLIAFFPIAGVLALAWWIGAYALIFGITLLILAFRLRRAQGSPPRLPA